MAIFCKLFFQEETSLNVLNLKKIAENIVFFKIRAFESIFWSKNDVSKIGKKLG